MPPILCLACQTVLEGGGVRVVLIHGRRHEAHCSEACLLETVQARRAARAARRRRQVAVLLGCALLLGGARLVWHRYRLPPPLAISFSAADLVRIEPKPALPRPYGPAWPPTDDEWIGAFERARWVYPLPGPIRHPTTLRSLILGPETPAGRPPVCRQEPRCTVELGGALWGEHVYAALDGVVDRVQRSGGAGDGKHGPGHYVRIAHLGGMVFTQYFHLAAIWHGVGRGTHVKAGDVIGLLGDTGLESPERHLHFAVSVRPSLDFAEVYWDPTPFMPHWPLRSPLHGSVAGFVPPDQIGDLPHRRPR